MGEKSYLDPKYTRVQGRMSPDIYTKSTFLLWCQEEYHIDEKYVESDAIVQDNSPQFAESTGTF